MKIMLGLVLTIGLVPAGPTFTKDVAPILYQRCVECHHPGSIAPMSLLDYKMVRPWASAIRQAVATGKMPPWYADPHYGNFANDSRLKPRELEIIKAWVDGGAPQGDPKDLPKAPEFTEGWFLGKPDIIIDIGQDYQVKPGGDDYEHFIVPTNLKKGIWIRAAELRPGNRRVVHHSHVNPVAEPKVSATPGVKRVDPEAQYIERDGTLTRFRMDAPVLNDACAANAPDLPHTKGFDEGLMATYLPGKPPDAFPDGTAKWIPAGTKLEFIVHYAKVREPQTDRTSIGLYLASGPPEHVLHRMDLRNHYFLIPPGEPDHEVTRCYTFEKDKILLSITPHMHFRGKDVRYEVTHPDGRHETLLSVPHYSFDWQLSYRFQDPILIEKGSTLAAIAHYDNSVNNPANPDPSKAVRWGDKSEEEMFSNYIEYLDVESKPAPKAAAQK